MDTFGLRIIASDKVFFNGRCKKLTIPAPDGEKGVLAHHENMVIAVVVGIARMESTEGEVTEIAVGTGFAEIVNNRVTLLVDTAERPEDIDVRHAREQRELFCQFFCSICRKKIYITVCFLLSCDQIHRACHTRTKICMSCND